MRFCGKSKWKKCGIKCNTDSLSTLVVELVSFLIYFVTILIQ